MFKNILKTSLFIVAFLAVLGVANSYLLVPDLLRNGQVVAYRGGGSEVNYSELDKTGCAAVSLSASGINTVENTLKATAESVAAGAEAIHLNVHLTNENKLVAFHDWNLDCATNASGPVSRLSISDLEHIDAGYGYTFDGGNTFPFRGKEFRISQLKEFYKKYPKHEFWLNLKSNNEHSFRALYDHISGATRRTVVITSSKGMDWFRNKDSSVMLTSVSSVKDCGFDYLLVGWAGLVPESCKNTILLIPPKMTKYFWGYPKRLAARLQKHGTDIYLWTKHEPTDPVYAETVASGVGVVTSDIDLIRTIQNSKAVNQD